MHAESSWGVRWGLTPEGERSPQKAAEKDVELRCSHNKDLNLPSRELWSWVDPSELPHIEGKVPGVLYSPKRPISRWGLPLEGVTLGRAVLFSKIQSESWESLASPAYRSYTSPWRETHVPLELTMQRVHLHQTASSGRRI